ncbi:tetratricopeptide repeat protein [Anabaena sp. PCC 7108]|uniref:tetratricopeptide repeat protein n=1 Tax=Anabaena sp. PCC 7108 TaxID=163908 RepID=UPI00036C40E6|nr:tetratricopeptide repeat protein [Anabaena sp. PCC 7108]
MPKVSWSSEVKKRVERFISELLSYALDHRDDLKLQYKWEDQDSNRPKLVIKTQKRFLLQLAQFEEKSYLYEAINRLKDLTIFEDRRFHKRGQDLWDFALKLWGKDLDKNLREFDQAWRNKQPEKSKQIASNKVQVSPSSTKTFAPLSKLPSNVPYSVTPDKFIGRSDELIRLHQILQEENQVAITAIAGMGGVGKTELAIQYTLKHLDDYPGGVCWLSASAFDLESQIIEFVKTHFPNFTIPEGIKNQTQYCWQNWGQSGKILVVVDNVTNFQSIRAFLPLQLPNFKVLCTTRERFIFPFIRLDVDVLKPLAAMRLLKSFIGRQRLQQEPWTAREICKRLGYLPLALELVGRYLADLEDLSLGGMLSCLEKKGLSHQALENAKPEMRYQLGIAAAFELSWERLDKDAQELGCLLSLFVSAPIPWSLVESTNICEDSDDLQDYKAVLIRLNLIKQKEQSTIQLHSLIREYFQQKLEQCENINQLKYKFIQAMVNKARTLPGIPTRKLISDIAPHIAHIEEAAKKFTESLSNKDLEEPFIFVTIARFYKYQGLNEQAFFWFEQCLYTTENRLGSEHPTVAMSLNNLGSMCINQGHQKQADKYLTRAIKIYIHLPKVHPNLALALNHLASLRQFQHRYEEAISLYEKSIQHLKLTLGKHHHSIVSVLNNWAGLYREQGNYKKAIELLMESAEICHVSQKIHPLEVSGILNHLGLLFFFQGCYFKEDPSYWEMSEFMYMMALDIRKSLLEEDHFSVAVVLNNIGSLYYAQGFLKEAKTWLEKAFEILVSRLGLEHEDTIMCRNNLNKLQSEITIA